MSWETASWIGVPRAEWKGCGISEGDLTGRFVYFRLSFDVAYAAVSLAVRITANSCYRLWLNGQMVCAGPCKGDLNRTYYDERDLTGALIPGKNVLAAQVLYNNGDAAVKQSDERAAIFGILTPGGGHRLLVSGALTDDDTGQVICDISTGAAPWKVYLDGHFFLKSEGDTLNLGAVCEHIDFRRTPASWKENDFDDSIWPDGAVIEEAAQSAFEKAVGLLPRFCLKKRPIPLLYLEDHRLCGELVQSGTGRAVSSGDPVVIPAHAVQEVILQAEKILNGYPSFVFSGGADTKVKITWFEKFTAPDGSICRQYLKSGTYSGITDTLILSGAQIRYEPFRYRTFRFLAIRIETADEAVRMRIPYLKETGYPLQEKALLTERAAGGAGNRVGRLWRICVQTLENCMMDTYMDCPYYEQMQFPMDTRLQMLFTYLITDDTRLPEKAIEDLHCSMTPEGLVCGKYPSVYPQIISTFSMHYIYMLREYVQQTGNFAYIRPYLPDLDRILDYYDRKIGEDGLVGRLGYWEFVDWLPQWDAFQGAPAALQEGPSTIINLMYAYALEDAAQLYEMAGRAGMAKEYRDRRQAILENVQRLCRDPERELYREGPSFSQFTCHAQAWAVLNGLPDQVDAARILTHAAREDDVLKTTFSTAYEWFRACEKAGVYDLTRKDLQRWMDLADQGCTCCPETPEHARSDCHAWSALPMYEIVRTLAGIKPVGDGWQSVRIQPDPEGPDRLRVRTITPKGKVELNCYPAEGTGIQTGERIYEISLPEGLCGIFAGPDGTEEKIEGGRRNVIRQIFK